MSKNEHKVLLFGVGKPGAAEEALAVVSGKRNRKKKAKKNKKTKNTKQSNEIPPPYTVTVPNEEELNSLAQCVLEAIETELSRDKLGRCMNELEFLNDLVPNDPIHEKMSLHISNHMHPDKPLMVWRFKVRITHALLLLFHRGKLSVSAIKQPNLFVWSTGLFPNGFTLLTDHKQITRGVDNLWLLMQLHLGQNMDGGRWFFPSGGETWKSYDDENNMISFEWFGKKV